jgi:hypothetical protein
MYVTVSDNYVLHSYGTDVVTAGTYTIWSKSAIETFAYIYNDDFDPLKPFENLLLKHSGSCNQGQF